MIEYVGVLLYVRIRTGLGRIILFLALKVRPKRFSLEKATAYECGFEPFGEARSPFDVGFYLVAILFLVFDIEVSFLLPWVLGGISTGACGFFCFVLFLAILVLGFVFEWQKGALDWTLFIFFFFQMKTMKTSFFSGKKAYGSRAGRQAQRPHHGYHLVDPSPWPALTRLTVLWLTVSLVLFFHQYAGAGFSLTCALVCLTYVASVWWRDVVREGVLGFHTRKVKNGLYLGMLLFIWSEAMFFVGLLWRFMHAALMPTIQIGMSWPPLGIVPLHWTGLPKTNTLILLRSYFTANAAKHALETSRKNLCGMYLLRTIGLGRLFMVCQYIEYTSASFTFSDTVYGSAFFLTTGFHGMHVFLGRVYLRVCFFLLQSTTPSQAVAFQLAIVYWHFVDVVWRGLLVLIYVWGSAVPVHEIERCTDSICVLSTVLSDRKSVMFFSSVLCFSLFFFQK